MCIRCTAQSANISRGRYSTIITLPLSERCSAENVRLGKQKVMNIVRQVLGLNYLKEMVSLLWRNFFSIIIDETTDQSTKKQLAILANFFNIEKFKMDYWLVDMLETDAGTALGI